MGEVYSLIMTGLGVGPVVVDQMDGREMHDLMDYWADHPPPHIAALQLRNYVMAKLGDKPPASRRAAAPVAGVRMDGKTQTPEQFAAMLGVSLEDPGGG